jgi:hypothetical protein
MAMCLVIYRPTLQGIFATAVAILAATFVFMSTPASAVDGRTAVGECIDSTAAGARCVWSVNDKGEIDICNIAGCVYCPSATAECTAAGNRPRPSSVLPAGAKVTTPVGSFDVKGRLAIRPLSSFCSDGERPCPGQGCIPRSERCNPVASLCPAGLRPCPGHGCIPRRDRCDPVASLCPADLRPCPGRGCIGRDESCRPPM